MHLQSFYLVITYKIPLILYVYSELFIYSQNIHILTDLIIQNDAITKPASL